MSRTQRLAALFRSMPGRWFDGRELASVAGAYAWRTRISELRRPPFNMKIENRLRPAGDGNSRFTISEYRFVPAQAKTELTAPTWELW